jgi:hypothetical protein
MWRGKRKMQTHVFPFFPLGAEHKGGESGFKKKKCPGRLRELRTL